MSTIEPHQPDPGYAWRWAKLAFSLMTRSPVALVLAFGGLIIGGLISAIPLTLVMEMNPPAPVALALLYSIPALICLPVSIIIFALLFYADTGSGPDWANIKHTLKTSFIRAMVVLVTVNLVLGILLRQTPDDVAQENAAIAVSQDISSLFIESGLYLGGVGSLGFLTFIIWTSILCIPFMLGTGGDFKQALIFDRKLQKMNNNIRLLLFVIILPVMMVILSNFPIWPLLYYYLLCYYYVAARELIGGIKENGKQTVQAPDALPSES